MYPLNPISFKDLPFSIIIPTCRGPVALKKCLGSIFDMDHGRTHGHEVIVVNDGGPVLDEKSTFFLKGTPVHIVNQANQGAAAARNAGAKMARGKFLIFLDDDCLLHRQWLKIISRKLVNNPPTMLGGQMVNGCSASRFAAATQIMMDYFYQNSNQQKGGTRFLASSNLVVPREPFLAMGGFDESFPGAGGEDRDFCRRWLDAGYCLTHVNQAIVYHFHDLGLKQFMAQHFNYGRGAFRYYRKTGFNTGNDKRSVAFYLRLLTSPLGKEQDLGKYKLICCLLLSQGATGLGLFHGFICIILALLQNKS